MDENRSSYMQFMYDESNAHKCENCPENSGFSNWQNRLPCGQQNCWVTIHCEQARRCKLDD